jgi:hypothetical protein
MGDKIPKWSGGTADKLRALISTQGDFEKWRKLAGFNASLSKPQIVAGVNHYDLWYEYADIIQNDNPSKRQTKPNGVGQPNAGTKQPKSASLIRLENALAQFEAAWALAMEMGAEVQAALREHNGSK